MSFAPQIYYDKNGNVTTIPPGLITGIQMGLVIGIVLIGAWIFLKK